MQKSILGIPSRDKAIAGMKYLVSATKSTLGPWGYNCLIEKGNRITNDGYTVSKSVVDSIKDEFERMGAKIIHEASAKTNDQVGDATTTSEVLAEAIVLECVKYLKTEGIVSSKMKPSEIIEKLKTEKDEVIKKLEKMVKPIETEEELINSAKVSVEDEELAKLIGQAQWKIGKDGMIIAEETAEYNSSVEYVKGIKFDNGYGTSMVINNPEKQTLEIKDCQVIMTNYVVSGLEPLLPVMNSLAQLGKKNLIIIARAYTEKAIKDCKANFDAGFAIYPINAPYTMQKEIMADMETILGGRFIDTEGGQKLEDIGLAEVGFATKLIARRFDAIIAGTDDKETLERVKVRVADLKKALKGSVSEFEKKMIQSRISQLNNGFAILKVGAETDVERQRKKDKADDATNAVRLAMRGGTVAGAGQAFIDISTSMPEDSLLKKPLESIYKQIMLSAPDGFEVPGWCRDPYLVLKVALTNAVSVASAFCTINGIVCSENIKTGCNCKENE
jgi:chaperonin GroEL